MAVRRHIYTSRMDKEPARYTLESWAAAHLGRRVKVEEAALACGLKRARYAQHRDAHTLGADRVIRAVEYWNNTEPTNLNPVDALLATGYLDPAYINRFINERMSTDPGEGIRPLTERSVRRPI